MPRSSPPTRIRRLLPLLLCLAAAQAGAGDSLPALVQAALARNPGTELAAAEQSVAVALQQRADLPLAGAPSVNLRYQTDQLGSGDGYREWEGGVEMPLWLPGQAGSFATEAERHRGLAMAMAAEREWRIAGEVRSRLWAAALAEAEKSQAEAGRDVAESLVQDVRQRVEAGELPRSDQLLAEKDLLLRETALLQSDSRAQQAEKVFERYTGVAFSGSPSPETPVTGEAELQGHPRLRLLEQRAARARAHRDRVAANLNAGPSLWLGGKTARDTGADNYASAVGVEISVPFGGRSFNAAELAAAEQVLTEALTIQMQGSLDVEDELAQARIALDGSRAAIDKTRRSLDLAEESLRLSRRAFELGETGLIDLLRAQNDALQARNDHELSRLRHGQAIARLNQALGVLPQ
jgi:outer membrane protein TolC